MGNSTFSETFEKAHPDRFYQTFIAEQVMVGAAMGLASRGAIPFPSTFACFLTRASDFVRMAGIGSANIKFAGSHAGVSIGEDGPSQMALEDLAMMRSVPGCAVFYPCDGMSAERLVAVAADYDGMVYIRTSRPKTEVIYSPSDEFVVGGSHVLRESPDDAATVVTAGVTVFEALAAYERLRQEGIAIRVIDAYSVQPIDADTLVRSGLQTGHRLISVEDHYAAGWSRRCGQRSRGGSWHHRLPPCGPRSASQWQAGGVARPIWHFRRPYRVGRAETGRREGSGRGKRVGRYRRTSRRHEVLL